MIGINPNLSRVTVYKGVIKRYKLNSMCAYKIEKSNFGQDKGQVNLDQKNITKEYN